LRTEGILKKGVGGEIGDGGGEDVGEVPGPSAAVEIEGVGVLIGAIGCKGHGDLAEVTVHMGDLGPNKGLTIGGEGNSGQEGYKPKTEKEFREDRSLRG
jgi:hypothetical protein